MLVGCDPEFVYFDLKTNKFVPANSLTEGGAALGCDGHSDTGEMRPTAKPTAKEVVSQIYTLFNEAEQYSTMKKVGILAGHYKHKKTIGGHIHLSGFKIDMEHFWQILDSLFIPLSDVTDDLTERQMRQSQGYGKGYREQGQNYIEYRMPGSWLLSPDMAYLHLGLAECIAKEYESFRRTGDYSIFESIKSNILPTKKMNSILNFIENSNNFKDKELLLNVTDNIFAKIPIDWNVNIKEYWLT